jgi:hypothetical protein
MYTVCAMLFVGVFHLGVYALTGIFLFVTERNIEY